jgi:hypothetical protein
LATMSGSERPTSQVPRQRSHDEVNASVGRIQVDGCQVGRQAMLAPAADAEHGVVESASVAQAVEVGHSVYPRNALRTGAASRDLRARRRRYLFMIRFSLRLPDPWCGQICSMFIFCSSSLIRLKQHNPLALHLLRRGAHERHDVRRVDGIVRRHTWNACGLIAYPTFPPSAAFTVRPSTRNSPGIPRTWNGFANGQQRSMAMAFRPGA